MADEPRRLRRQWGFFVDLGTQKCVVHGTFPGEVDDAGELKLWFHEGTNEYHINASSTARGSEYVSY